MGVFYNMWSGLFDSSELLGLMMVETIKASVILASAILITIRWKSSSAGTKYLILSLAIASVLVLPFLSVILSAWLPNIVSQVSIVGSTSSFLLNVANDAISTQETSAFLHWSEVVVLLWLGGVALRVLWLLAGTTKKLFVVKDAYPVDNVRINGLLSTCRNKAGVRHEVRLLESKRAKLPFTCGWFRPAIILPPYLAEMSHNDLEAIFLHELAHVKRWDTLFSAIALVVSVINWFNPLVWISLRRLYLERERACDDYVLKAGIKAPDYAELLLNLTRLTNTRKSLFPVGTAMARKTYVPDRIKSVLSPSNHTTLLRLSTVFLSGFVTLSLTLMLSCVGAQSPQPPNAGNGVPAPDEYVPLDSLPEMIYVVTPEYPASAKEAHLEGTVWINVLIDTTGNVQQAIVAKSSGETLLDNAALATARENKFKPAQQQGKPVFNWVSYPVQFTLSDSSKI
jgi:TonB family protein